MTINTRQIEKLTSYATSKGDKRPIDPKDGEMAKRIPVGLTNGQMKSVEQILMSEGTSFASYIRALVVDDLRERGIF